MKIKFEIDIDTTDTIVSNFFSLTGVSSRLCFPGCDSRESAVHHLQSHRALRCAGSEARACIGRRESARVVRRGNDRTNADRFGETPKVLLPRKVITHTDSTGRFAPTKIDGARADNEDGPVISRAISRPSDFRGYFRE